MDINLCLLPSFGYFEAVVWFVQTYFVVIYVSPVLEKKKKKLIN